MNTAAGAGAAATERWAATQFGSIHFYRHRGSVSPDLLTSLCGRSVQFADRLHDAGETPRCANCLRSLEAPARKFRGKALPAN